MEFKINEHENKGLYDISLVQINSETPEMEAFKSIKISFFNNLVVFLSKLIIATNLIILGHLAYEKKVNYELFMTYQIGVYVLLILGKFFITGILKYLFEDKEEMEELYNLYIKLKTILIFLVPIIIIPTSICSYYIIKLLLIYGLKINDQTLNKKVYFQFLLYTPAIYLFELLFILNLQFLHYQQKRTRDVFLYIITFLICHITLSFILLYLLNFDLYGLTISYFVNTFLFYLFSNRYIRKLCNETSDNFFIFPNKSNFTSELFDLLKEKSYKSLINTADFFYLYFLFLITLFTDKNQLIVNIIFLNFYIFINSINKGFYFTLKRHIAIKIEEMECRQRYVKAFSFYFIILCLSLFIILILFKNILLNVYLYEGGDQVLQKTAVQLRIIFPLCILISGIKMLLNGIIRGMKVTPISLTKKAIYYIACIIICLVLLYYKNGILQLWMATFILILLIIFETTIKQINYLKQFFHI